MMSGFRLSRKHINGLLANADATNNAMCTLLFFNTDEHRKAQTSSHTNKKPPDVPMAFQNEIIKISSFVSVAADAQVLNE